MILLVKGEPLGGKELTGSICPHLFLGWPFLFQTGPNHPLCYFTNCLTPVILLVIREPLHGKGLNVTCVVHVNGTPYQSPYMYCNWMFGCSGNSRCYLFIFIFAQPLLWHKRKRVDKYCRTVRAMNDYGSNLPVGLWVLREVTRNR